MLVIQLTKIIGSATCKLVGQWVISKTLDGIIVAGKRKIYISFHTIITKSYSEQSHEDINDSTLMISLDGQ